MSASIFSPDSPCIKVVNSFDELVSTPFGGGINALCWQRQLVGDFREVLDQLLPRMSDEITTIRDALLNALPLSPAGEAARTILLEDQKLLRDYGLSPILDCIHAYPRDSDGGPVPTDVYSFHADSATVEADTYLCTYIGAPSEGVSNEEAQRRIDIPETRAELLKLYGGTDEEGFLEFLKDNCYDLHYALLPHARPFSFGVGNLWRIAIEYPGCPVPPCIHRAPANRPGDPPRLLLIS